MTWNQQAHYARIRVSREAAVEAVLLNLKADGCVQIEDFPAYWISPAGRVYSTLGRRLIELRPGIKPGGYAFVGLRGDEGCKYHMVHRLVARAFIPNPLNLPAVNHKNGHKLHNAVGNLEWCTHLENSRHAIRTGLTPQENALAKLTNQQVRLVRDATGTYKSIGKQFGICAQAVCNVKLRRTYRNVV